MMISDLYKDHFSAIVGLPAAAFISTFLILLLKVSEKGASGVYIA